MLADPVDEFIIQNRENKPREKIVTLLDPPLSRAATSR
jgi:hypothetical protein